MTQKEQEIKDLKNQNKKLRELVTLYNSGQAKIVICSKCGIPLQSKENRIRILYNKRKKDYGYSDRQLAVFHIDCFKKLNIIKI